MANQGKRMVKENLIAQIGQGGAEYTAGTGIDITEDIISVDTTTIQEKLTAGDNITISDGTISATDTDTTYTAGVGIDIDANNEITADIKAGSGIVVDTDLTDDSLVVMVNDDIVQGKLTAGTGIDITTNTISTDEDVELVPTYGLTPTDVPGIGTMSLSDMISAGLPILSISTTSLYPDNTIEVNVGDKFRVKGYFGIQTDDSTGVRVFTTADNGLADNKNQYTLSGWKNAGKGYMLNNARYRSNLNETGLVIYNIIPSNEGDVNLQGDSTKNAVAMNIVNFIVANPVPNIRYGTQLNAPTTDGTYTLKVTVTSGKPTFSWVLDTI